MMDLADWLLVIMMILVAVGALWVFHTLALTMGY